MEVEDPRVGSTVSDILSAMVYIHIEMAIKPFLSFAKDQTLG